MPTTDEVRAYARELTSKLIAQRAVHLVFPWDGCTIKGRSPNPEIVIEHRTDASVTLPAWGADWEERVGALLLFSLEVLKPGLPCDLVVLADAVNDSAREPYTHDLLREVIVYWRSRLAVEDAEVSEYDLLVAARGDLTEGDYRSLYPRHRRYLLLRAAALLLAQPDGEPRAAARVRLYLDDALEEGR